MAIKKFPINLKGVYLWDTAQQANMGVYLSHLSIHTFCIHSHLLCSQANMGVYLAIYM